MNILFVGTIYDKKHTTVTGQTVVSDIVLNQLKQSCNVIVVNTADSGKYQRGTLLFNITRILQFIGIFFHILIVLLTKSVNVVYYQPATSGMGVARDYISLKIISFFRKSIVLHLLGYIKLYTLKDFGSNAWKRFNYVYGCADKIIVEGEKMKSEFKDFENYLNKVVVIPNGLNVDSKRVNYPKNYNEEKSFKLLYLSNFIFSKGYYDVIQALDILVNQRKLNVECIFAGKYYTTLESVDSDRLLGTEEAFNAFIKSHGLQNVVKYYPGLFGNDKHKAFVEANAFVLPTYYSAEGQPMSILEAMSYGCVPIVTAHGHIPMMVNNDNGCLVSPKHPLSIADAVESLMTNTSVYTNKSAKAIIDFNEKFRGESFGNAVKKVIMQVGK